MYCFINGCKSSRYKRKHVENKPVFPFYKFPKNPLLKQKWVDAIYNLNHQESVLQLPMHARICIQHFDDTCIEQFGFTQVRLKKNSVPSIFPNVLNKKSFEIELSSNEDCTEEMEHVMDSSDMVYIEQGNEVNNSSLEMETLMQENCTENVESATGSCDMVQQEGNEELPSSSNDVIIDMESVTALVATTKTEL
ncbi:52 kDa repressor of the inhibitor of the protein kinase-like [Mycetomoellerius zeteki]|uniref:52 kDa repressor of the inhibitor of the protein kinase-like n=1 Tax=Mycetomoellerius zeteki TaxID=64791 RepID=UPI00084EAB64|nr:PREDICTED: 52 kDa repressor of the inhibitor of the protein kinase-like [Trachymyrmex zeteki]